MARYYQQDQYFTGPKDQIIHQLEQEIYEMQSKIGNYDILRKNMIDLELNYRELLMKKASNEDQYRGQIGETTSQNADVRV